MAALVAVVVVVEGSTESRRGREWGVEERGATCWLAWRDGSLVAALGLTATLLRFAHLCLLSTVPRPRTSAELCNERIQDVETVY